MAILQKAVQDDAVHFVRLDPGILRQVQVDHLPISLAVQFVEDLRTLLDFEDLNVHAGHHIWEEH
jgi:hypothetical protein